MRSYYTITAADAHANSPHKARRAYPHPVNLLLSRAAPQAQAPRTTQAARALRAALAPQVRCQAPPLAFLQPLCLVDQARIRRGNSGINSPNPTTSRVDLDSDASGSKSSQDGSDSEDIGGNNGWLDDGLVLEDDWQTSNQLPSENGGESADESGSGQSNSDGAASTESELQQVLSDLDGNIIEQRSILRGRNDTAENAGNPDSEEIGPAGAGADATSATAKRSSQTSTRQNQPQISNRPAPPSKRGSKVPENIPDARDDDIIARQLREAAMQEEDEELREKLWEEYRRYKKG